MSSSSRVFRPLAWIAVLVAPIVLAGCTGLTPVYGTNGLGQERVAVRYGQPASRLDQIIYEELSLRLGKSGGDVPTVTVATTTASRSLTNDTIGAPSKPQQMTVTAQVNVTDVDGTVLLSRSRSATADYTNGSQGLANQQAADDAAERAARQLADTLRLEIIAALAR